MASFERTSISGALASCGWGMTARANSAIAAGRRRGSESSRRIGSSRAPHLSRRGSRASTFGPMRLSCRYNGQAARHGSSSPHWTVAGPSRTAHRSGGRIVCHSMGGLIARWYIEKMRRRRARPQAHRAGHPILRRPAPWTSSSTAPTAGSGRCSWTLPVRAAACRPCTSYMPEYACIEQGDNLVKTTERHPPRTGPRVWC